MYPTTQDLMNTRALGNILQNFPGLEKYENEVKQIKELGEKCWDLTGTTEDQPVESASGMRFDVLTTESAEQAYAPVASALKIVKKLKADKELMEKEPFLKGFLGVFETNTERSFSDSEDTFEYFADDATAMAASLSNFFDKLPTGQEYQQLSEESKNAADKILNVMEAYTDCYGLKEKIQKAVRKNPTEISEEKCKEAEDKGLEKLEKATREFASIPQENVKQFYLDTGNESVDRRFRFLYDKKHNPETAASQLSDRRRQIQSHMAPEEARLLQSFASEVKGVISNSEGAGCRLEDLPETYRNSAQTMIGMENECREKLKEGFQSEEEKLDFFKNLGETTRSFCQGIDQMAMAIGIGG